MLMNLWNGNRSMCRVFPQFLIVGPQKTGLKINEFVFLEYPNEYLLGTTALHNMLSQHPDLHPSKKNLITYEELQFFSNDKIYLNGIDWFIKKTKMTFLSIGIILGI